MSRQEVLLIKRLLDEGYKDKHICMIVPCLQPYVSKIRSGTLHANTNLQRGEKLELTTGQEKRLNALNRILEARELMTSTITEDDKAYIQLLKFLMVDKEKVYELYYHISKKKFGSIWTSKKIDIRKFNSELIGVPIYDYLDLIIDYFI